MRTKEEIRVYQLNYRLKNKEKLRAQKRIYTAKNSERIKKYKQDHKEEIKLYNSEYNKTWYPNNKKKRSENHKRWYLSNQDRRNAYAREYRKRRVNDIQFHLTKLLRTRLYHALKGNAKKGSAIKDLGCTVQELKTYLENRFQQGMSWDNWSYTGWNVDHIKPLVSFDLTDRQQLLEAVHYTNLQPLWAIDNHLKGSKISEL